MAKKKDTPATNTAPAAVLSTTGVTLNMTLLASLISAPENGIMVAKTDLDPFLDNNPPLVMFNPNAGDGNGNFPSKATDAGVAFYKEKTGGATVTAGWGTGGGSVAGTGDAAANKTKFSIVSIPKELIPVAKRAVGAPREATYPFDTLPAPDASGNCASFFIPATDKVTQPWKKYSSTVSSATRRYSVVDATAPKKTIARKGVSKEVDNMKPTRQFSIREFTDAQGAFGTAGAKGALISRVA